MITMVAVARPQVLSGDYNAREAYDAVPQLHARGEGFIQNIRTRARKAKAKSAQLMQMSGQEQGSRKLLTSAMASLKGTDLEVLHPLVHEL
jgi:hypothetical protein